MQIFSYLFCVACICKVESTLMYGNTTIDPESLNNSTIEAFKNLIKIGAGKSNDNLFYGLRRNLRRGVLDSTTKLNNNINILQNILKGYGCWCDFDNYNTFRGNPKDKLDFTCQQLFTKYAIIQKEMDNSGYEHSCQIHNTNYQHLGVEKSLKSAIVAKIENKGNRIIGNILEKMLDECENENLDICKSSACVIETEFLFKIYELIYESIIGESTIYNASLSREYFDTVTCDVGYLKDGSIL